RAVPPAEMVCVLRSAVLRIVNEEVGAFGEGEPRGPRAGGAEVWRAERGLVIGKIREGGTRTRETVADGRAGVADRGGRDAQLAQLERVVRDLVEDQRRDVAQTHREERGGEIAHEALAQAERRARGSPEMHFDLRLEERREEAEPLDVVHVKMGQKQV